MKKRRVVITSSMAPAAFVAPVRHEPTDAEFDAMTETELDEYCKRHAPVGKDGMADGWGGPPWDNGGDDGDALDEDWAWSLATDAEKAAAPSIDAAIDADFQDTVPHGDAVEGVTFDDRADSAEQLTLAVAVRVNRWKKPPKPEVIVAAVGLALAYYQGIKGVKHPRDIAKQVRVRPQTLFKVRKIALELIHESGLAGTLPAVK